MDDRRFDALARALAGAATRRGALGAALAALVPFGADADGKRDRGRARTDDGAERAPSNTACLAVGRRCGTGKRGRKGKRGKGRKAVPCTKCCSRHAVAQANGAKRCACKPAGTAATNAAQCCSGRLSAGGFCGACDPGLAECNGACVDTSADDANCGRCANACADGQRCLDGACACDASSCPNGCCDGTTCRPGTADGACGTGGVACASCAAPDTCGGGNPGARGACGCTPDAAACAGKNCGTVTDACGVGHACGSDDCGDGFTCTSNVCTCLGGNAVCGGICCGAGDVCTDGSGACCTPDADACAGKNCGTVTDACGVVHQCGSGTCAAAGEICCDGVCRAGTACCAGAGDCGACEACQDGACVPAGEGEACAGGQVCHLGACVGNGFCVAGTDYQYGCGPASCGSGSIPDGHFRNRCRPTTAGGFVCIGRFHAGEAEAFPECSTTGECGAGHACVDQAGFGGQRCYPLCAPRPPDVCAGADFCTSEYGSCGDDPLCSCGTTFDGAPFCGYGDGTPMSCTADSGCPAGQVCRRCPTGDTGCVPPCPSAAEGRGARRRKTRRDRGRPLKARR